MSRELELLSRKHKKWISLVESLGCSKHYAEDVVQDAYVRIHDYLQKGINIDYGDNDVNDFYMYMTLRSIYINSTKKKKINIQESYDQEMLDFTLSRLKAEYSDVEMEGAYVRLINKIFSEVNTWEFYHKNMFIAYFTTGLSLDKLSSETNIGRSSLYNSIRKYREVIQDLFSEDAEDFFNGDFSHIK